MFGKGPVAIRATEILLAESYKILFVVPSSAELADQQGFGEWAHGHGIEVRRLARLDDLDLIHADLGISAFYDRIFKQRHIDKFGMLVNVHNSLLPHYRGVRPINWALKNGEVSHGVTIHMITPGIDEGPILAQEQYPIDPGVDEVRDVYGRALTSASRLLERALPRLWDLQPAQQKESDATHYTSADDEQLGERRYWTRTDASL